MSRDARRMRELQDADGVIAAVNDLMRAGAVPTIREAYERVAAEREALFGEGRRGIATYDSFTSQRYKRTRARLRGRSGTAG